MTNYDEEMFEVFGSTDLPMSNVLEKGRYKFMIKDISNFVSQAGNRCIKVTLDIDGKKIFDNLMPEGKMAWKWNQLLFSIGIRQKGTHFTIPKSKIVGKEGLVDIGVKDRALDDGSIIKENKVNSYSPIEQEVAPIKGVEPEDMPAESPVVEDEDL